MVIQLLMNKEDSIGKKISYSFIDDRDKETIASATNHFGENVKLQFLGKEYELLGRLVKIPRYPWSKPYPDSMHTKNMLGFRIMCNGSDVLSAYSAAMTIEKRGLTRRNIGFTVYGYEGKPYGLVRIGFKREPYHWYSLLNQDAQTVAIFQRHSGDDSNYKVTAFIEDEKMRLLALLVCVEKFVVVSNNGASKEDYADPTMGPYVSRYEEEQKLFDRDFLARAKFY